MEKKPASSREPSGTGASGEFRRAGTLSEPVRKDALREEPLVLDMKEFEEEVFRRETGRPPPGYDEEEPDTARYTYITDLEQLKALFRGAVAFSRGGDFDPAGFAEKIVTLDMCTRDRDEPHYYYFLEDKSGNQYRLYMEPQGTIDSRHVRPEERVVLDFGGRTGYLFPLAFQSDERSR
ncbi:MAG TPA: hypothetical protein VLD37_04680 [Candidatus Bilamarchaeum sp.]|nr:hypothetical protein [Candidatus Bilamarchaeum sp.]